MRKARVRKKAIEREREREREKEKEMKRLRSLRVMKVSR
jgi:hypothetical protein